MTETRWSSPVEISGGSKTPPAHRWAVAWSSDSSPTIRWNCLGFPLLDNGHRRVPPPPDRMTGRIIAASSPLSLRLLLAKIIDSEAEALIEQHLGFPIEQLFRLADVRLALLGIVRRKRMFDDLRLGTGQGDHLLGQLTNSEFVGVADVNRTRDLRARAHQPDHAFDQIVDVAEGPRLAAVAVDADRLALQ